MTPTVQYKSSYTDTAILDTNVILVLQFLVWRGDGAPRRHHRRERCFQEGLQPEQDEPRSGGVPRRHGQALRPALGQEGGGGHQVLSKFFSFDLRFMLFWLI